MDIYEALTIADIISDHVTEPCELDGAMARLKRAWPEFAWLDSQQDDGHGGSRRAITIDTRDAPTKGSAASSGRCGGFGRPENKLETEQWESEKNQKATQGPYVPGQEQDEEDRT